MVEKLGKLIIAGFRGSKISQDTKIQDWIINFNISGIILYDIDLEYRKLGSRNIKSEKQLKELNASLQNLRKEKLFISIDQEGGQVNRLNTEYGFPKFKSWRHLGLINDKTQTRTYARKLATILKELGINFNLAPVLDLDFGKNSFISKQERAMASDPQLIIEHSRIYIDEMRKHRILCCGKHFPGQGSASGDTHEGLVDITKTWQENELMPYKELIKSGKLDAAIVAHTFHKNFDSNFPSSMSFNTINQLFRNDLGFNGVVISDDPSMKAISDHYDLKETILKMINAGVDLFIFGNNLNYDPDLIPRAIDCLQELFKDGLIQEDRIDQSLKRIDNLKSKL